MYQGSNIPFEVKVKNNVWDSMLDILKILRDVRHGKWFWYRNSQFKYVNIRVDMRDGRCIFLDNNGNRVDIENIKYQYERTIISKNKISNFIHIKTGNIYYVLGEAINSTNDRDGQIIIIYSNKEGQVFVREKNEFLEKFKPKG